MNEKMNVLVIGGGMIAESQLLPSLYHLQRLGCVGRIKVCARHGGTLKKLAESDTLRGGFPGHSFEPHPDYKTGDLETKHPELYKELIASQAPRQLVVVATPDHLHYEMVKTALENDQHVLCVKPFVLKHEHSVELERMARDRGLLVGIEYHKRHDYRALMARDRYRAGQFGEFRIGWARLFEPWFYRHSNFQNWFTCDQTDAFTYIGCHYVDLCAFITGLRPMAVSVYGIREEFPNSNEGFLWTNGRVIWENGACLSVTNALGYPDGAAGSNTQGMALFGRAEDRGTLIWHSDQYRGVKYSLAGGEKIYHEPNPDFMQFVAWRGDGVMPVGYGYRSVEFIVQEAIGLEAGSRCSPVRTGEHLPDAESEAAALAKREELLNRIDEKGLVATPGNSSYNELVIEAGRLSILNDGREVTIAYGKNAGVKFRRY